MTENFSLKSSTELSLVSLARSIQVPLKQAARGRVLSLRGPLVVAKIPDVAVGDLCQIARRNGQVLLAQAVGFEEDVCLLAPFDDLEGVSPHAEVKTNGSQASIVVGRHLIGKVVDPLGLEFGVSEEPADPKVFSMPMPLQSRAPNATTRLPIKQQLQTGVKSIDLFCAIGYGQRMGLIAGPGAGKSTLLGMIAKNAEVDISVIALVGERGREVNEFITETLGTEGLQKSVLVVSTSDESPMRRVMAAQSATAIAEYFRAQGKRVLLLIDSLTRVARAIRDVSLAAGELPLRQGFTPSVYAQLPRLLERAGNSDCGSITALYTVLTQEDDSNDALGEELKSILDGHIVLSNQLVNEGIRPAVDILSSISRLRETILTEEDSKLCRDLLRISQRIRRDKDIVLLGGQADKELQVCLGLEDRFNSFLSQKANQAISLSDTFSEARELLIEFNKRMKI